MDIWACGITLYYMLTKNFPFAARNLMELQQNVQNKVADLSQIKDESLFQLLARLLDKDPNKRIKIYDLIEHSWVTSNGLESVFLDLSDVSLSVYSSSDFTSSSVSPSSFKQLSSIKDIAQQ